MERPARGLLFATLSILWIFPSAGPIWIVGTSNKAWLHVPGPAQFIQAVRLEEWIALAILLAHAAFLFLAWRLHGFRSLRH